MLNISQSLLHLDQYRFGIKSPVLLYSLSIAITNSQSAHNHYSTILQLETALCYQHYFCNTELRTAIITEIKGLLIQTQQNMFALFTLFKLTSDECKTLTKVSTRKTSHNDSPKPAHPSDAKEQENQQTTKTNKLRGKSCLHNWWRIRGIRISLENTRQKK